MAISASNSRENTLREKKSKYGLFSGPYFPAFGLNTERYSINLRIQPECRKIRPRKNSVFGHFSRSDISIRKYSAYSKLAVYNNKMKNWVIPENVAGLNGNKLIQVRKTGCHFYLPSFRRAANSTLERMFLDVPYQNRISWSVRSMSLILIVL